MRFGFRVCLFGVFQFDEKLLVFSCMLHKKQNLGENSSFDENSSTIVSLCTEEYSFSSWRQDAWAEKTQCKTIFSLTHLLPVQLHVACFIGRCAHGNLILQHSKVMNLRVNPTERNQVLESNREGCQKLMNSLRHFPLSL